MCQYIGVNCIPVVCANVQVLEPGAQTTKPVEFKSFAKEENHLKSTNENGQRFFKLDLDTVKVLILTDASSANVKGMRS